MQEMVSDLGRRAHALEARSTPPEWLLLRLAALVVPIVVGASLLWQLREGFGLPRLAAKSLLPFATLVPLAAWLASRRLRDLAGTLLLIATATTAVVACFAVFGLPVHATTLAPLLGVGTPWLLALALGVALLVTALRARLIMGSLRDSRIVTDSLLAVVEGVYFGGFLIGATGHLGLPAGLLVAGGQLLAASARGVPFGRALVGSGALVLVALWSGSAHAAIAVHLLLLGSPEMWQARASISHGALRRV